MPETNEPIAGWRPKRSFANTDTKAVKLAELLHEAKRPQLTILFGSRARGDYAEGSSDIDILVIEDHPPDEEAAANAGMAFRKAKAELYRGQCIDCKPIVTTLDDFRKKCSGVNSMEGHALKDGCILGDEAEYYAALARRIETRHQVRWANGHLKILKEREGAEDEYQGVQAYLAVTHALKAAVNAARESCPEVHDVEMLLLEPARQADPAGHYATLLDPEIYTQYGDSRKGIPPHTPFTGRPEYREWVTEQLREAWPSDERNGTIRKHENEVEAGSER